MVSVKSIHIRLQKTKKVYIYVYFMYLSNGLCMECTIKNKHNLILIN